MSVHIEEQWAAVDMELLRGRLAERASAFKRCVVVGIGAGGRAALLFGRLLAAEQILVWAPSGGVPSIGFTETATAAYGTREFDRPGQTVHICTASDTEAADMALLRTCWPKEGEVRVDHCDLPYPLLPMALRETGRMVLAIRSAVNGKPGEKQRDLGQSWRTAFRHKIDLDLAASGTVPGGAFRLAGQFQNLGPRPLDLDALNAERILMGARIRPPEAEQPHERRFQFTGSSLPAGEAMPFHIVVDRDWAMEGTTISIALVCERSFWFDNYGFPRADLHLSDEHRNHRLVA
ncbi:MAG: hypothetical protein J7498_01845 [Sphingobium sp.]|nr:hypothetical protein [Sphingobium sp.]